MGNNVANSGAVPEPENEAIKSRLLEHLAVSRREILGLTEAVYGTTTQWMYVRSQLLSLLGDRGLAGKIECELGKGPGNGLPEESDISISHRRNQDQE